MNTIQLESIFLKIGGKFQGIFTNRLFRIREKGYYIVNTVSNAELMGHWVLFYYEEDGNVLFIDSLAQHPSVYGGNILINFRDFYAKIAVKKRIQSNTSLVCGLYCIHFTFYLNEKYSMKKILSHFSRNYRKNDRIVERILPKLGINRCQLKLCPVLMYNTKCFSVCTCSHLCNK